MMVNARQRLYTALQISGVVAIHVILYVAVGAALLYPVTDALRYT